MPLNHINHNANHSVTYGAANHVAAAVGGQIAKTINSALR
jgi:hypothetical protein